MDLKKKILLSMIVPALLICTVAVVGIFSLHHLRQAAGRIISHNYHTIVEARTMEQTLRLFETAMLETHIGKDGRAYGVVDGFERSLIRCENNITEDGEHQILAQIRKEWEQLQAQLPFEHAARPSIGELQATKRVANSIYQNIDALVAINEKAMFSYEEKTRTAADVSLWGMVAALLLAIGALAWFSLVSARRISGPITEVSKRLHNALNPDGSAIQSGGVAVDEIAVLKQELEKLLGRLAQYENEQQKRLLHMQSRLAFVINEVLEGLVLIDDDHNIVAVNRVARHILGIREGDGRRLDELKPREDVRAMLKPVINGLFQSERDLGELEFMIEGVRRVYRPRVLTISSNLEQVEGFLLLFWDVTEQRRFEESRRKFISMLSHQLKTPMTSLSMSVNLLREKLKNVSSAQAELLSIASEDCNSLAGLISDLIEAAREPAPDLSLRLRNIEVSTLLRTGLRPLISQAREKGITLSLPAENSLKAWVDPIKFPWVITNIAGNALRYTNTGGTVEISILGETNGLVFTIADTGIGIAPENLTQVFEPYVTIGSGQGTHGLGLAIAKEIVEAHRGTISVESRLEAGTVFSISIPYDARERV